MVSFPKNEYSSKISNLESAGYELYVSSIEDGVEHSIMVATEKSRYWGSVCDVWDNGRLEYSGQFKKPQPQPLI